MDNLVKIIEFAPELKDQVDLLQRTLKKETHLALDSRKIVAWATAIASQDMASIELIKSVTGELSADEKKIVTMASSRMAVTNPYFMSRNVHPLNSDDSLSSLSMRPFPELEIENKTGYHYACIAISLVNHGFVCLNSHINSLKSASESDAAIDQAMKISASVLSIKQIMFNAKIASLK